MLTQSKVGAVDKRVARGPVGSGRGRLFGVTCRLCTLDPAPSWRSFYQSKGWGTPCQAWVPEPIGTGGLSGRAWEGSILTACPLLAQARPSSCPLCWASPLAPSSSGPCSQPHFGTSTRTRVSIPGPCRRRHLGELSDTCGGVGSPGRGPDLRPCPQVPLASGSPWWRRLPRPRRRAAAPTTASGAPRAPRVPPAAWPRPPETEHPARPALCCAPRQPPSQSPVDQWQDQCGMSWGSPTPLPRNLQTKWAWKAAGATERCHRL